MASSKPPKTRSRESGRARVATIGPRSDGVAADPQSQHEHRDDERRRMNRVAKDIPERAYPHDLINRPLRPEQRNRR